MTDVALEVICRRCLIPGRGWRQAGQVRCEPCHRAELGDEAVDDRILSDFDTFGDLWVDELLDRVGNRPDPQEDP